MKLPRRVWIVSTLAVLILGAVAVRQTRRPASGISVSSPTPASSGAPASTLPEDGPASLGERPSEAKDSERQGPIVESRRSASTTAARAAELLARLDLEIEQGHDEFETLRELARLEEPEASRQLLLLAESSHRPSALRSSALAMLRTKPMSSDTFARLRAVLTNESDYELRREALAAVGRSDRPERSETLIHALVHDAPALRAIAARHLPMSETKARRALSEAALRDADPTFRRAALQTLAPYAAETSVAPTVVALASSLGDEGVRIAALQILGQPSFGKDAAAVALLRHLSLDPAPQVRFAARDSLKRLNLEP